MTDSSTTVELASIEGLLRLLDRGLGNFSLYAASSPVYVQTLADLRLAFASLWARVPLLTFSMEEEALRWEGVPEPQRTSEYHLTHTKQSSLRRAT